MLHIKSNAILRIASVISFFLIWQFSSLFFDVDLLPSPHSVFSKIIEESVNRELFFHTAITLKRVIISFFIATSIHLSTLVSFPILLLICIREKISLKYSLPSLLIVGIILLIRG